MSTHEVATVRFGPLEQRGVLLGLGFGQLGILGFALLVALVGVYSGGPSGLIDGAPIWLPLAILATVNMRGRPLLAWLPLVATWQARSRTGATTLVARPTPPTPQALTLPGVRGPLSVTASPTLAAALVLDQRAGTVTAIARVRGAGFVLDDAATQDTKVSAWGRVLATTCQMPRVLRVQVLSRTVAGGSAAARSWWQRNAATTPSLAGRVVAELLEGVTASARRPEVFVAVALRSPRGSVRRLSATGAETLQQDLAAIGDALRATGLVVDSWVDISDLGAVLRTTYDPVGARDASSAAPTSPGDDERPAGSSLLGPMGAEEHWAHLRTDSGVHATYWVVQWPRSEVHPAFLNPLLVSATTTRTVSLIAEPVTTAQALREIRRAKVEHAADATRRVRIGQIEDEATRAEVAELSRREAELVAGHGDLRFTGLITVTAPTLDELEVACTATEAAAAQAMCEVRRLVGQQAVAHAAAALPLARGVL
ncbi:SCO6880 family protein [Actinotalea sp. Marseille-Q4924]|uniref:SCO6880 family protein n=1 Tax=Actinotalea sp. Marseille-Q4924 TaxID=2866571 RepID=UPI001CE43828|nr:SCO6880 family protein [Actinotalea sp. Marseille-Q4924]